MRAGERGACRCAELDAHGRALAERIAAQGPIAVRYAKEAMLRGLDMPLEQALRYETDLTVILQTTADRAEGVRRSWRSGRRSSRGSSDERRAAPRAPEPAAPRSRTSARYDAPFLTKLRMAARNNWIKARTRKDCCGNDGEPGC